MICGFQNTNLYTMVTAPWYTGICFPKTDLVQALTKSSDTELIDYIGKSREVQVGYGLELNGTDNYIDTGEYDYADNIKAEIIIETVEGWDWIASYGYGSSQRYGIGLDSAKNFCVRYTDKVLSTSVAAQVGVKYSLELINDTVNSEVTLIINDQSFTFDYSSAEAIQPSTYPLKYGVLTTGNYINMRLLNYSYTINNQPTLMSIRCSKCFSVKTIFCQGDSLIFWEIS
jgi:hypothetical protein